ncbi:MAG: methyltransferase [Sphingomonas sp.]|uniref:class I SAM-dependent methyltransferase n=1 Tax=Sphingomonas sp. TaxID=28214 RepID=UPI00121E33FB|nr:methyltransferase [Sphingomonas sp.]THD36550.1 MAG: methyltransferase [Sphingomonas sp.]
MLRPSLVLIALTAAPIALYAAPAMPSYVAAAVADPDRPQGDRDTDANRKPAETIAFAGVKPGMTVGEFYPGGGYYTRMLSRVVGPRGHVYGMENVRWKGSVKANDALVAGGKYPNVSMEAAAFGTVRFAKPLDLAWVTQNYHDLKIAQYGVVDTVAFDRGVFNALKPGGTFFVLDHEAPPGTDLAGIARLHRIERAQVIREVTSVGFKLADEGTFLRRPSDDHTLPIFDKKVQGQTDQYALKFVKPAGRSGARVRR